MEWAALMFELEDAHEHLGDLIAAMRSAGAADEIDYRIRIAHVFAHLNRAWHTRSLEGEASESQREEFTQFPRDLEPVG